MAFSPAAMAWSSLESSRTRGRAGGGLRRHPVEEATRSLKAAMAASAFPSASKAFRGLGGRGRDRSGDHYQKRYVNERCAREKQFLHYGSSSACGRRTSGRNDSPLNFAIFLACITLVHHFDSSAIDQWFAICGAQGYLGLLGDAWTSILVSVANDRGDVVTGEEPPATSNTWACRRHPGEALRGGRRVCPDAPRLRWLRPLNIRKQRQILIVGDAGEFADVAGSKQVQGGRND